MAREAITLSTARRLVSTGAAKKEALVARFDIVDDEEAEVTSAPSGFKQQQAKITADLVAKGAMPGDRAALDPTLYERAVAWPTNVAGGIAENVGGLVAAAPRAALDTVSLGPARRIGKRIAKGDTNVVGYLTDLPVVNPVLKGSQQVEPYVTKGIAAVEEAAGVRPNVNMEGERAAARTAGNFIDLPLARWIKGLKIFKGATKVDDVAAKLDEVIKLTPEQRAAVDAGEVPELTPEQTAAIVTVEPEASPKSTALAAEAAPKVEAAPDKELGKYAEGSAINLNRMNVDHEAKQLIDKTTAEIKPDLEAAKGATLTNDEVREAAVRSNILRKGTTREATLKSEAALLATRQQLAKMAKDGKITPEFVETIRIVSSEATRRGRELQALAIGADPIERSLQSEMVKKLVDLGMETETIVKAAEGVDFSDMKQATAFYRQFVKPTLGEMVDEFRYINMLSSPKTHIINAFSNMLQTAVLRPAVRLVSGGIDNIGSSITGKQQEFYLRQVPAFYRGAFNSMGEATSEAAKALRGTRASGRLELDYIPTGNAALDKMAVVTRALEAGDVFFRTMVKAAEREAIIKGQKLAGKAVNEAEAVEKAAKTAAETIFRKPLDTANKTGQGDLLTFIDSATAAVQGLRRVRGVKWFVPFVETPMNIMKQGIEYSPLGFATVPDVKFKAGPLNINVAGAANKTEQSAKALIGSIVFAGAGSLAMADRTTWAAPKNKKEKEAFYASGRLPYSVKVGDKWVGYARIGPLAYPVAMAAAIQHYAKDNPKATSTSAMEKTGQIIAGIGGFFADQSYMEGIGRLVDAASGETRDLANVASMFPQQLVPLGSLQRWVAQIIDPVYRQTSRDLSVESILNNLKKGIPVLSESVPPMRDSRGREVPRPLPFVNAMSPVNVSNSDARKDKVYQSRVRESRRRAEANARKERREKAREARRNGLKK